eukprot:m.216025 g.216025  ORF g.216025 m.216025 type:complete len:471 (+) comp16981_c1_seq3:56-1468(+)
MAGSALPFPSLCFPFPFPFLHTGGGDSTSTMRRDGRSIALQSAIGFLFLSIIAATIISQVNSAGYSDGRESGPEAQKLRLQDGELPRHGLPPGKGLIDHYLDVDVVVAGGGSTGVSAALAAARSGAQTVLIHGRPVLGGNAGSEIKLAMVGACGPRASDANELKMECREGGIVEEYTLDNAVGNPNRIGELFSLELYNKFRMEPNVQLFLNTWLVAVEMNGTRITTAIAEDQMSQNRYIISAKQFIDATGDGRLGAEAGAQYLMGREGPSQYNESLAEGPDTETEGSSLAFVSVDMGIPQPYTPPPWAMKYNASDFKYRSVNFFQYGYWWNEVSWPYNTISDNEVIRDQLLANMFGIWDYIKNSGDIPGMLHHFTLSPPPFPPPFFFSLFQFQVNLKKKKNSQDSSVCIHSNQASSSCTCCHTNCFSCPLISLNFSSGDDLFWVEIGVPPPLFLYFCMSITIIMSYFHLE